MRVSGHFMSHIYSLISKDRLARVLPNELALELQASADTALAEGLAGATKQASH